MHIEGLESLLPEGKGGFSQVFRATDRFGRTVAAKVSRNEPELEGEELARVEADFEEFTAGLRR